MSEFVKQFGTLDAITQSLLIGSALLLFSFAVACTAMAVGVLLDRLTGRDKV